MLSLTTTTTSAAALDRADSSTRAGARTGDASETAQLQAQGAITGYAQDTHRRAIEGAPGTGVAHGLSTVAAVGVTIGSVPAALCRMSDIALASGSGTLSDSERANLRSEYAALTHQVTSAIGETGRAEKVQAASEDAPTSRDGTREQHQGRNGSGRHDSGASPLPHAAASKAVAAAPAAPAHTAHRVEAAPAAALAQFRRQQSAPRRTRLSVEA